MYETLAYLYSIQKNQQCTTDSQLKQKRHHRDLVERHEDSILAKNIFVKYVYSEQKKEL